MLESYINNRLKKKEILLMTHIVLGYPSFETSEAVVEKMVASGVDLMELQIPFSEPLADGPVILAANQKSLGHGTKVEECLSFAKKMTRKYEIPFLFMTYYNILFKFGVSDFAAEMAHNHIAGSIIPDLPPEEARDYMSAMSTHDLAPIFLFSPTTSKKRMVFLNSFAKGFIYCVARKGVTGEVTDFSDSLGQYLKKCREATTLPLAVGFGIKNKADVDYLKNKAEIAVIGSETIRIMDTQGVEAVGRFIQSLR